LKLVDAHIHLVSYPDPGQVARAAKASGTLLLSCTVNPGEAGRNLELKETYPEWVRCFLGVHPSDATQELPSAIMEGALDRADGIGEIGLDPKYSEVSPGSAQMKAFLDQLGTAERLGKPVEVHSRGSERACLEILGTFRLRSVLMHWFEGENELEQVVGKGYYVSVGPALLYSKKLRRIASRIPVDRLLSESDGPVSFLALEGRGGFPMVPSVVFCLAETKRMAFDEVSSAVEANVEGYLMGRG